ncbi:hypothetical protein EJK50_1527 [Moraxella catarrhalis]|nr:hypothetical protein EJK50_1527 [Moraxella catarrhalis]
MVHHHEIRQILYSKDLFMTIIHLIISTMATNKNPINNLLMGF